jgi:hypothetical protein
VRNFKVWSSCAVVITTLLLASCGGGSSNSANVRLLNATASHANLSLLANANVAVPVVPINTVSTYASVDSGSPALQVNDSDTGTALVTTSPSVGGGQHYVLVAYESGGTLRTAVIQEDNTAPTANTAVLRIFDAATDAGAVDVYVTDATTDLSTVAAPTFSFPTSTQAQAGVFLSFAPGTYRVRVVGSGNIADLRLDIPVVTLVNQEIATVFLTPTSGGTLANGGVLIQQGAYTASINTSSRVRLAAAVTGGSTVTAAAGSTPIGTAVISPAVGAYTTVASGSALTIIVNGATVAAPPGALAAGSDSTLFVYGNSGSVVANLIADDNHVPTISTNYKIRMLNGITGASTPPLTMDVNFAVIASNIAAGTASTYSVIGQSASTQLDVFSPASVVPIYTSSNSTTPLVIPGGTVFTLFMLGDSGNPIHLLRKDR